MQVPKSFEDSFKFWINWKETAVQNLKKRWSIEDAGILIAFFEQTILAGLCTPRAADKQVIKVIKPTRLSLLSMAKYFQAQVILSESRESILKSFLIFDGISSYLERHYHPQSEALCEDFQKLIPYLSDYREEVCSLCDVYGRPYLLPNEFWQSYKSTSAFYPLRPIIRHFLNRVPNLHPENIEIVDFFRDYARKAIRIQYNKSRGRQTHTLLPTFPLPKKELMATIEQLEVKVLESCSRYTILDRFLVLEGLLMSLEEHWFIDSKESHNRFKSLRSHLLEGFTYLELLDYIKVFQRPYQLTDD